MTYVRKTEDEYEVQVDYGQGWELVTTETTWKLARDARRAYRENDPRYPVRVKKRRVKKEGA